MTSSRRPSWLGALSVLLVLAAQAAAQGGATAAARPRADTRWSRVVRETEAALDARDAQTARQRLAAAEHLIDAGGWPASSARHQRWLLVAGLLHQSQADLAEARRRFERAVAREPGWAEAWLALGTVHETIALLPDHRLGIALASDKGGFERTRREEVAALARDCYVQALRAQPRLHEARLRLGRVQQLRGDLKPARAELERVGSDAPTALRYLAQLFLGDLAERRQDWAEARSRYLSAAELVPQAPSAHLALDALSALTGEPSAATRQPATAVEARGVADGERDPWWVYFQPGPGRVAAALANLRREIGDEAPTSGVSP